MGDLSEVLSCHICGSYELSPLLDLGEQPLAEDFSGTGKRYPLILLQCGNCGLGQLAGSVDQEAVFTPTHPYASGNTAALREHFMKLALEVMGYMKVDDLVVDIGANDGTFLQNFIGHGVRMVAVEPTDQIRKTDREVIDYQEFFTHDLAVQIRMVHGPAKVITATNVMAHVPDVHDFMNGVGGLLAPGGIFVAENHDLASVLEGMQFDTIYHEHLRYYTPESFARLLGIHDFRVQSIEPIATHGGSFRTIARKMPSTGLFGTRVNQTAIRLHAMVRRAAHEGPVYGIGAATRAVPLLHYARLGEYLQCVCEVPTSDKIGKCMPGTFIPVVDEQRLFQDQPPHALLFSWHLAVSLIPNLRSAGYRGKFIIPLPEPRIIDG